MVLVPTGPKQENKTMPGFGHLVSGILIGILDLVTTVPYLHVTMLC